MKYGSFCTGYGGLDLAVETYFEDAEMLWYSEVDKNCNKILEHRFPGVTNIGDLTQIENWNDIPQVDLICAGFPCQPYSTAGLDRKGDEDERAIFQYIADSLGVLGFPELFLENVSGILTLGGTSVIGSLAEIGYDCQWQIVGKLYDRAMVEPIFSTHTSMAWRILPAVLSQ